MQPPRRAGCLRHVPHTPFEGKAVAHGSPHQVWVHSFPSLIWTLSRGSPGAPRQKPVTAPNFLVPVCEAQGRAWTLLRFPRAWRSFI